MYVCGKGLAFCDPVNDNVYNNLFLYVVTVFVVENHSRLFTLAIVSHMIIWVGSPT